MKIGCWPIGLAYSACLLLSVDAISEVFRDCGGVLSDEKGYIHSPNFPDRFPTPLSCNWVIHAPPDRKIILYFTQYFLRENFYLAEYDHYENEVSYSGKNNLGEINFEDEFTSLVAYKPYVVISLNVRDNGNIHLRVEKYLQEVYGFNITYQLVDRDQNVRKDTCSVHECSFLGHCLASSDYREYKCNCFDGFFGNECQYGPFCDPEKGTNMCQNGGRCRYFYGSFVNTCECPTGYEGSKCELKTDQQFDEECKKLGCSQECQKSDKGKYYCSCIDGYKLDDDNSTCIEKEMFRITVEAPVAQGSQVPAGLKSQVINITALFHPVVMQRLTLAGLSSAVKFGFDRVRDTVPPVLQFHFYVESTERSLVKRGLDFLTIRDLLFGVPVDTKAIKYSVNPEMKLLAVDHYGQHPAVEGHLLTIMCTARGSSNMVFRWYKDNGVINATLSQRNAWEIRIPRTIKNKQISVLNIDGVTFYDKGDFTCEIEDFGEVDKASIMVDVITYPLLEMRPMAVSVTKGGATSFLCLSPDDTIAKGSFTYNWLKNGKPIPSQSPNEIEEDVFPTGRRMRIRRTHQSANYTCIITGPAGSTNKTAYVFVNDEDDVLGYCEQDIYEGVTWMKTFGNSFDVQQCPTDSAGYSRRWCRCTDTGCSWSPPNFVTCQSGHLILIYDRLEKIRLGYIEEKTGTIWDDLYNLILQARGKMYAGDVDVTSTIVKNFVKTLIHHPSTVPVHGSFSFENLINLIDVLLSEAFTKTEEEKESLYAGPKILQVAAMTSSLRAEGFIREPGLSVIQDKLAATIQNVKVVGNKEPSGVIVHDVSNISAGNRRSKRDSTSAKPQLYSDVIKEPMFVYTYTDMCHLLDEVRSDKREKMWSFIAGVRSVFPLDSFLLQQTRRVELDFHHPEHVIDEDMNKTMCLSWRTLPGSSLDGYWTGSGCDVIQVNMTTTTCLCEVPGHITVTCQQLNITVEEAAPETYNSILLLACVMSLCGLVAALLVLLVTWKHLLGRNHYIHINLIISLAVIDCICIVCLEKTQTQAVCIAGKILLQFFFLATFSFLFVEAVHTFVVIHAWRNVKHVFFKYFVIGWGIPTLTSGCVVIVSERYGYDGICGQWCWLSDAHWLFYSFVAPAVVLVIAQIILSIVSVLTVRGWKEEWRYKDRRKHMISAGKGGAIVTLLIVTCISGSAVERNPNTYSLSIVFLLLNILLGLAVFILYTVSKHQVRISLRYFFKPAENKNNDRRCSTRSFKAYMMPEMVNGQETIGESIHRHQEMINRNKFTKERKKQLENLLGSSSTSGSGSGSASGSGSGSGSGTGSAVSDASQIQSLLSPQSCIPGDSGISEDDFSDGCSNKVNKNRATKRETLGKRDGRLLATTTSGKPRSPRKQTTFLSEPIPVP